MDLTCDLTCPDLTTRQAGLSVFARAMQLWNVGAGLPLDALKKGAITSWTCPYELTTAEISPLLDALCKNASLTYLDLRSNEIPALGAFRLVKGLLPYPSDMSIDLANNFTGGEAKECLRIALAISGSRIELDVDHDEDDDDSEDGDDWTT